jgi:hypothetical protein
LHMRTSTKLNTSSSISQSLPFFISDLERVVICKWCTLCCAHFCSCLIWRNMVSRRVSAI